MTIPLTCKACGALVGEENSMAGMFGGSFVSVPGGCPGKGNHPSPKRHREKTLFWLEKVTVVYPETHTSSSWYEYVGKKTKLRVWLAILYSGERGVVIDGNWCWWKSDTGFFGDGAKQLA